MQSIEFKTVDPDPAGEESHLVWEWRNDPVARQMSRSIDPISWEQHQRWFQQAVSDPKIQILIASRAGIAIGMVRLELIEERVAEVNININPALRGKGFGQLLLNKASQYAFETMQIDALYAEVKPENVPSIKIFEGAGFHFERERDGLLTYRKQLQ
jgi:UDP-4-amino-4,6-dideoxy-N-acetyl-beta-L-altrosamine N-acetyltransferase